MLMVDRRTLLFLVGSGSLAVSVRVGAQPATSVRRVDYLNMYSTPSLLEAFRQGLRDHGWKEGENLVLEARVADGYPQRIPHAIGGLLQLKVDVILLTATVIKIARPASGWHLLAPPVRHDVAAPTLEWNLVPDRTPQPGGEVI